MAVLLPVQALRVLELRGCLFKIAILTTQYILLTPIAGDIVHGPIHALLELETSDGH
jgi:hypothetical protein